MTVTRLRAIEVDDESTEWPPMAAGLGGFGWLCLTGIAFVVILLVSFF